MSGPAGDTALLIVAHGERQPGAGNESTLRIARAVAAKGLVKEVAVGFISGVPTVAEAFAALAARKVIVYPLFASNGYFTRDRLVGILDELNEHDRSIHILRPLGLDPGLPKLLADHAANVAHESGLPSKAFTVILLAHGSRRNPASREATEWVAAEIGKLGMCLEVKTSFLEERPFLDEVARSCPGPAVVVGMFSGEGLHGGRDAPRLVAQLDRADVFYSGVICNAQGIDDAISSSLTKALARDLRERTSTIYISEGAFDGDEIR